MPVWLIPIANFFTQRALHIIVIAALCGLGWGIYYKLFVKDTTKTIYTAPSYHEFENPHYAPFSCAHVSLQKGGDINGKKRQGSPQAVKDVLR